MPPARSARLAAVLVALVALIQGCTIGSDVQLRSTDGQSILEPQMTVLAYVGADKNTANIFLTDLSRGELDTLASIEQVNGYIIHIHMFLAPKAGKTPIAETATNATVRFMVIAEGAVGIYEGAGFLLPTTSTDRPAFIASMEDAPLRLILANDRFADPLGNSLLKLSIVAPLDAAVVTRVSAKFGAILSTLPAAEPELEP